MLLYSFILGDVEDPQVYAAGPILDWQNTEAGAWIMENVIDRPQFHIEHDMCNMGYRVAITGKLTPEAATFYTLKYK